MVFEMKPRPLGSGFFCAQCFRPNRFLCAVNRQALFLYLVLAVTLSSCLEQGCTDPEALNFDPSAQRDNESCRYGDKYVAEKETVIANYADMAFAMYSDALNTAIVLDTAINAFLQNPTDDGFSMCRLAWQSAKYQYAQCAPLRFYEGPVDDSPNYHRQMGAWPINPAIIDYTPSGDGGLVADLENFPVINEKALEENNSGPNLLMGLHVIEFLLWGLDVDDPEDITVGYRTFEDYDLVDSSDVIIQRRRTYLKILSAKLVADLTVVRNQWDPTAVANFREEFVGQEVDKAMKQIMTGLGTLSRAEMAERAIKNVRLMGIEENEISAYSDNTIFDLIAMNSGMEAITNGSYTAVDGTITSGLSLVALAALYDEELSNQITAQLELNKDAIDAIPAPFDYQMSQELVFGDGPIAEAEVQLEAFEDLCFELAREMDFGLNTDLP